jgi:molybdenum cofactor cytidylyltransferase
MIGAVVIAAGESKRMGRNKLLIEIGGKPLIKRVISFFEGVTDELVVVLGHRPEQATPLLKKLGARWVVNEGYAEGMASSFKRGLKEMEGCEAVFLALGDQPFVDRNFLREAIKAWRNGAKVVSPAHEGKKGHPVLFDKSLFSEILSLEKQGTVRDVIHMHGSEHKVLEAGEWAVVDIDSPEDLERTDNLFSL